jgi:MFS family permease
LDIGTVIWFPLNTELGIPFSTLSDSFAANLAGLAVGCIFLIPLAAMYGRRPVYLISTIVQMGTAIWQARMKSTADLIGSNVVSGFAGAVSESIVQMTISDLFFVHQRATMNAIYLSMVNTGAFLSPIAAGYSAQSQGWRWIWWWTAIFLGVALVLQLFFYEETKYIPRLPSTRAEAPATTITSDDEQDKANDIKADELTKTKTQSTTHTMGYSQRTWRERFALYTLTPGGTQGYFSIIWECVVLLRFPAVAYTAIMYGSSLAWFSILLNTLSIYFTLPPYNFGPSAVGLMNLPPFIGALIALAISASNDWVILKLAKRNKGVFEPEMRLWMGLLGVITGPAGMLLFGLSMAKVRR